MVGNNIYFDDYKAGYVGLRDIPYKYWNQELISYALKREPAAYYEKLLEYSIAGVTGLDAFAIFKQIPDKYKTLNLYRMLSEQGDERYKCLIPLEILNKLVLTDIGHDLFFHSGNYLYFQYLQFPKELLQNPL